MKNRNSLHRILCDLGTAATTAATN